MKKLSLMLAFAGILSASAFAGNTSVLQTGKTDKTQTEKPAKKHKAKKAATKGEAAPKADKKAATKADTKK